MPVSRTSTTSQVVSGLSLNGDPQFHAARSA